MGWLAACSSDVTGPPPVRVGTDSPLAQYDLLYVALQEAMANCGYVNLSIEWRELDAASAMTGTLLDPVTYMPTGFVVDPDYYYSYESLVWMLQHEIGHALADLSGDHSAETHSGIDAQGFGPFCVY